jgi:AraC-like DNA-binding protein
MLAKLMFVEVVAGTSRICLRVRAACGRRQETGTSVWRCSPFTDNHHGNEHWRPLPAKSACPVPFLPTLRSRHWIFADPVSHSLVHAAGRTGLEIGDASIAQVAAEFGYESEAAFNRSFKKCVGMTPGSWRKARYRTRARGRR